jgi:protein ImuB
LTSPPPSTSPPPDLRVEVDIDPPVERIDAVAFLARTASEDVHHRLTVRGNACARLTVGVETDHGERHERTWRVEGAFSPTAMASARLTMRQPDVVECRVSWPRA